MTDGSARKPWQRHELTYCSNVHPAETYAALNAVVAEFVRAVRQRRGLDSMGAGLWINHSVASELLDQPEKLHQFHGLLTDSQIDLFALNGFPYGDFHAGTVKEHVYTPDWSESSRLLYTQQLAEILAYCLPDNVAEGTISTLPLGFRHGWNTQKHSAAMDALCKLANFLENLHHRTGRSIRVCLEMEPDCVLETTDELVHFFQNQLPETAAALGIRKQALSEYLGICFDVCHQAVMFEHCGDSLSRIAAAGIAIGKIQISSALSVAQPVRHQARQALAAFAEPKYLHQVRTLIGQRLAGVLDLPLALTENGLADGHPWHIHFHVPIQTAILAQAELGTTQAAILETLDFLKNNTRHRPHIEVETYTWQVLPITLRPQSDSDLIEGLSDELGWLEMEMYKRGLVQ
ncbi:MAG: metabolite traffic protein EboE [Methylomonas sp.]|uniref:metabolite traffic protein EboE n=1 Tax=Methylomonas sp. TaxID=418 RepID=UPI0025F39027|nr:metabolite traffic protein EboE [Methylomonas sp.]MCK9607066.1 metabolite traffic protein EboE [Methylomonas sp.]